MENLSKKDIFKFLIKEFHTELLPVKIIDRELEIPFLSKKIITVFGPRRSGKSFYFFNLIKKIQDQGIFRNRIIYLNFEDDRILPLNFKDLDSLLEAYFELYPDNKNQEIFFLFDEIQNIENWEVFIRRIYDKEKARIFITGSSSKLLSKEIATSLRGRTISFPLFHLNFREFLRFKGEELEKDFEYTSQRYKVKKFLEEYLEYGGFPEVVLEKDIKLKKKILEEYFSSLVYRDLSDRFSITNTSLLKDLLKYLFSNIISLFSVNSYFNSVKQILPVSRETISDYLSFIQETGYFFFLPQFSYSLKVQEVNPKKIICLDNGLRNIISFRFSKDEGRLAENLVGSILKMKGKEIFYWREKREVDFVKKENNKLSAINVTFGETIDERETISLLAFKEKFREVKELILINKDLEKKENQINFIPLWKWLLIN